MIPEHLKMNGGTKFESQYHFSESPSMSSSIGTTPERPSSYSEPTSPAEDHSPINGTGREDPVAIAKRKLDKRIARTYVYRIREHVKMGPKLLETVKGKLSVGAKIIQKGGRENVFREMFAVSDGEQLLKASQCYLSTTAGPIAGILFISTQKVAFCSERPITVPAPSGLLVRTPYKVIVPVMKIKKANERQNVERPTRKYLQIVTEDDFEFWFMGFVRYEKAFLNLQKAIFMYK